MTRRQYFLSEPLIVELKEFKVVTFMTRKSWNVCERGKAEAETYIHITRTRKSNARLELSSVQWAEKTF